MKKGLFGSVFAKLTGKAADDIDEKRQSLIDEEETVGRWKILTRYGKEKTPEASEKIFTEICERTDRCALILMDYNRREQMKASENMSWIYDVNYEQLNQEHIQQILAVGKRCYDYKVRCLLAGINPERIETVVSVDEVHNLVDISKVDTICLLASPSNHLVAETIKNELVNILKKEEGIE